MSSSPPSNHHVMSSSPLAFIMHSASHVRLIEVMSGSKCKLAYEDRNQRRRLSTLLRSHAEWRASPHDPRPRRRGNEGKFVQKRGELTHNMYPLSNQELRTDEFAFKCTVSPNKDPVKSSPRRTNSVLHTAVPRHCTSSCQKQGLDEIRLQIPKCEPRKHADQNPSKSPVD